MGRGTGQTAENTSVPRRGADVTRTASRQSYLSQLTEDQQYVLSQGYSASFNWTAVIAPEPQPLSEESSPAIYLVSDLPDARPSFVTATGRIGSAEQLPEGNRFSVDNNALALPKDLSGKKTTEQIITKMREWLADNSDAPVQGLNDHQVVAEIKTRYEGGVPSFTHGRPYTPTQVL